MPPPPPKQEYCRRCKMTFDNWDAYHRHLVRSDKHHACWVCGQEYINQAALDAHCKLNHAHAQNLRCLTCHMLFKTLGGLTAHIEFDNCITLNLAAKVRETTDRDRKMDAARNFLGGRSGGNDVPKDEPRPVLKDYSQTAQPLERPGNLSYSQVATAKAVNNGKPIAPLTATPAVPKVVPKAVQDWAQFASAKAPVPGPQVVQPYIGVQVADTQISNKSVKSETSRFPSHVSEPAAIAQKPVAVPEEEDLISFDAPSLIMNGNWDDELPLSVQDQFPVWSTYKNPMGTPNIIDAAPAVPAVWHNVASPVVVTTQPPTNPATLAPWGTVTQVLVSDAESAADFSPANLDIDPPMSPWDPDNPAFNAAAYRNDFTGRFRCPHPGCKKHTIPNKGAFIDHLKSPAHRHERLQCHGCLRYFDSATALAQHASAQGIRCRVRETDDYDNEVERFTAGFAEPDGRHNDDTIKYKVTIPKTARGFADARKAAMEKEIRHKDNYWKDHVMRW